MGLRSALGVRAMWVGYVTTRCFRGFRRGGRGAGGAKHMLHQSSLEECKCPRCQRRRWHDCASSQCARPHREGPTPAVLPCQEHGGISSGATLIAQEGCWYPQREETKADECRRRPLRAPHAEPQRCEQEASRVYKHDVAYEPLCFQSMHCRGCLHACLSACT